MSVVFVGVAFNFCLCADGHEFGYDGWGPWPFLRVVFHPGSFCILPGFSAQ